MEVLIVDDNVLDRKYIKYLLENNLNISPVTAKDGADALKKVKAKKFDLIITDIVMPNIEGIELIEKVSHISSKINIIAVSGNNPYYLYILNKMGIENTFTKPIETDEFLNTVKNIEQNLKAKLEKA